MAIETKCAVIVVEDDASVLSSLRRLLTGAGFRVQAFDRPSACRAADLPGSDACLLIDIHLPEMNGVELCRALAVTGHLLPVVLMTGHLDMATDKIARSGNPVALLIKPFTRALLMDAIRKALQLAKPAQEA